MLDPILQLTPSFYHATAAGTLADGTASGIRKTAISHNIQLRFDGIASDVQADKRVHGGPAQALHHFPAEHYLELAQQFPQARNLLVAGSIGENLSTYGLTEHAVHIGDLFALGTTQLKLTYPRRPCWKIDRRYDAYRMAGFIRERGITGWYYAVVVPGEIAIGDHLTLLERQANAPTVGEFHAITSSVRPALASLEKLLLCDALAPTWRTRLTARLNWLQQHA